MKKIDLRSDTVTLPTKKMLDAIQYARLGDDCYQEDSTVNQLEEIAAKLMGKEKALLCTSGTQANLIALLSHCNRGEEVILEKQSHIYGAEVGGISAIAGLIPKPLEGYMGALDPNDVEQNITKDKLPFPRTTLICLENTHNRAGGCCLTSTSIQEVSEVARKHNLKLHIDGERIFNAAIALGVKASDLVKYADSNSFSLSKGLSCPVGSLLSGSEEFIKRARRYRRMVGGGLRQAGIIAAPGIIALETMIDRLKEDHHNAKLLANALSKIRGIDIILETVQTNIIVLHTNKFRYNAAELLEILQKRYNILGNWWGEHTIRLVTHRGIEEEDITYTIRAFNEVAST